MRRVAARLEGDKTVDFREIYGQVNNVLIQVDRDCLTFRFLLRFRWLMGMVVAFCSHWARLERRRRKGIKFDVEIFFYSKLTNMNGRLLVLIKILILDGLDEVHQTREQVITAQQHHLPNSLHIISKTEIGYLFFFSGTYTSRKSFSTDLELFWFSSGWFACIWFENKAIHRLKGRLSPLVS